MLPMPPELLLCHPILIRRQAALAMTSRAWAAISKGCRRTTAYFDLELHPQTAWWRSWQLRNNPGLEAPDGDLAGLPCWLLAQQQCCLTNLHFSLSEGSMPVDRQRQGDSWLLNPAVRGNMQVARRTL